MFKLGLDVKAASFFWSSSKFQRSAIFKQSSRESGRSLCQVKSSHLYLYSAFNNTDCVKALNSIKLEDRVSVMYNNKIKHSIFS